MHAARLLIPVLLLLGCREETPAPARPAPLPAPAEPAAPPPAEPRTTTMPEAPRGDPPASTATSAGGQGSPAARDLLEYPRDAARKVARVETRDLTLADLVAHVTARHDPGFADFLGTTAGNLYFQPPHSFGADWVRHFADIVALEAEAGSRGSEPGAADPALGAALKRAFEAQMQAEQRARGEMEWTQEVVDIRLAKYQREHGLAAEVQGWLDFLVSADATEPELYEYFYGNPRVFGGKVTLAHILVRHRDPVTAHLLDAEGRRKAWEKLADARARLKADGSNFAEVAALTSEDRRTAERGGVFDFVDRFDARLPAALCRAAWSLKDGEITGPIESPYGLHLVRRISFVQQQFILYTDAAKPTIREVRRKHRQEDLLFAVRERRGVELRY